MTKMMIDLTRPTEEKRMRVFHDFECQRLRRGTCDCGRRTEYEPPIHYIGVDGLELKHYEEDKGDSKPWALSQWLIRHVLHQDSLIMQEIQSEGPLRPFVEGEPIGVCNPLHRRRDK
jgi:hypothetical protein